MSSNERKKERLNERNNEGGEKELERKKKGVREKSRKEVKDSRLVAFGKVCWLVGVKGLAGAEWCKGENFGEERGIVIKDVVGFGLGFKVIGS